MPDSSTPLTARSANIFKGNARRIGLAQALINDPDLIILDEPPPALTRRLPAGQGPDSHPGEAAKTIIFHRISWRR